jgi:dUTP pyrophosphatase
MDLDIKIKLVSGMLEGPPAYATEGSAGFDVRACLEAPVTVLPRQLVTVPTGIAIQCPPGYAAFCFGRSGRNYSV